jgi:hypothetical protein
MKRKKYHLSNWTDYNKALEQHGSISFWISKKVIKNWKAKSNKKRGTGHPKEYSDVAIRYILTQSKSLQRYQNTNRIDIKF